MSSGEHAVIGQLLLTTVVAFFALALPGYWLIRRYWPESGWNLGGSVTTSCFRKYDLVILGVIVFYYVMSWRALRGVDSALSEITTEAVLGSAVFYLIGAALVPVLLFQRANLMEYFGLSWEKWLWIFLIVPAFLGVIYFSRVMVLFSGWDEAVKGHFGTQLQQSVQLLMKSDDKGLILAMVFAAVIAAPIAEEVIFRGYIYPVVKRYSDGWFAALFSASLFGAVHMNLLGFPMFVIIGLAMVVLYEKSGSIWPCIFCHMAFNGMGVGMILLARFLKYPLPV